MSKAKQQEVDYPTYKFNKGKFDVRVDGELREIEGQIESTNKLFGIHNWDLEELKELRLIKHQNWGVVHLPTGMSIGGFSFTEQFAKDYVAILSVTEGIDWTKDEFDTLVESVTNEELVVEAPEEGSPEANKGSTVERFLRFITFTAAATATGKHLTAGVEDSEEKNKQQ